MKRELDEYDCFRQRLPVCPHCGTEFPVWDDDNPLGLDYDDGAQNEFKCVDCRKTFIAVTEVCYRFHTAVDEEHAADELCGPQEGDEPVSPTPSGTAPKTEVTE